LSAVWHDDDVGVVVLGPGLWQYTCTAGRPAHRYRWESTAGSEKLDDQALGGKSDELGLRLAELPAPWRALGRVWHRRVSLQPAQPEDVRAAAATEFSSRPRETMERSVAASARIRHSGTIVLEAPGGGFWPYFLVWKILILAGANLADRAASEWAFQTPAGCSQTSVTGAQCQ
jgi:hypothetical protein